MTWQKVVAQSSSPPGAASLSDVAGVAQRLYRALVQGYHRRDRYFRAFL